MASNQDNVGGQKRNMDDGEAEAASTRCKRNTKRYCVVSWTETSASGEGVDQRKEMVLGSWLSADEAVVYWPTDNYRFHLIRESTPSEDWSQFPVNDIRLRDASEEDCEKLMAEMSQEDSEGHVSDQGKSSDADEESESEGEGVELQQEIERLALESKKKMERKQKKIKEKEKARKERAELEERARLVKEKKAESKRKVKEKGSKKATNDATVEEEEDYSKLVEVMSEKRKKMEGKAKSGRVSVNKRRKEDSDDDDVPVKRKSMDAATMNSRLNRAGNNSSSLEQPPPLTPSPLMTPRGQGGPPLHYTNNRSNVGQPCACCNKLSEEVARLRQDINDMVAVVRSLGRDQVMTPTDYILPSLTTQQQIMDIENYTPTQIEKMIRRLCMIGGRDVKAALRNMIGAVITPQLRQRINKSGKHGKMDFSVTKLYHAIRAAIMRILRVTEEQVDRELSEQLKQMAHQAKKRERRER